MPVRRQPYEGCRHFEAEVRSPLWSAVPAAMRRRSTSRSRTHNVAKAPTNHTTAPPSAQSSSAPIKATTTRPLHTVRARSRGTHRQSSPIGTSATPRNTNHASSPKNRGSVYALTMNVTNNAHKATTTPDRLTKYPPIGVANPNAMAPPSATAVTTNTIALSSQALARPAANRICRKQAVCPAGDAGASAAFCMAALMARTVSGGRDEGGPGRALIAIGRPRV